MEAASIFAACSVAVASVYSLVNRIRRRRDTGGRSEENVFGITMLNEGYGTCAAVDVIFIHGVGVDSKTAWSASAIPGGETLGWPQSELPRRLSVPPRIIFYDYDSKPPTVQHLAGRTLLRQAPNLIRHLARLRGGEDHRRPIVFIAQGLGGLLLKNALVESENATDATLRGVFESTIGLVFLGTPHNAQPSSLASWLKSALDDQSGREDELDLVACCINLAYNLERFKAQASGFVIQSLPDAGNTHRGNPHALHDGRKWRQLLRIWPEQDRNDTLASLDWLEAVGLNPITEAIDMVCKHGLTKSQNSNSDLALLLSHATGTGPLQLGNILPQFSRIAWTPGTRVNANLDLLDHHCRRWLSTHSEGGVRSESIQAWPVLAVCGAAGAGKTYITRQFIEQRQLTYEYGSVLWVNAGSRRSIESSFLAIARRIDEAEGSQNKTGSPGVAMSKSALLNGDGCGLRDSDLRTLVHMVSEWLERPQLSRWLLVLDDLSLYSLYPHSPVSTGQYDPHQSIRSWTVLFSLLASASATHGHIIVTTRDDPQYFPDCSAINLQSEYLVDDAVSESSSKSSDRGTAIRAFLDEAKPWERRSYALCLFLTDNKCSSIYKSTLQRAPENYKCVLASVGPSTFSQSTSSTTSQGVTMTDDSTWISNLAVELTSSPSHYPGLQIVDEDDGFGTQVRLRSFSRERSHDILSSLHGISDQFLEETADAAWETVYNALQDTRSEESLVPDWNNEEKVLQNCGAVIRQCTAFVSESLLPKQFTKAGINWSSLAAACERHSEYEMAYDICRLAYEPTTDVSNISIGTGDLVVLAHSYQHFRNFVQAEKLYNEFLREGRIPDVSKRDRMAIHYEFASMLAAQGEFEKAAEQAAQVLALEDPFGSENPFDTTAAHPQIVAETIYDLVGYLVRGGHTLAAAALLQRLLMTLERTKGTFHTSTMGALEALATLWQQTGDLIGAHKTLALLLDRRTYQLGLEHPSTLRCQAKLATVLDLQGRSEDAEREFQQYFQRAGQTLGPKHPAMFRVRENYALCLMNSGKNQEAEEVLRQLKRELKPFSRLHRSGMEEQINEYLGIARRTEDYPFVRDYQRNTLSVADFLADQQDDM